MHLVSVRWNQACCIEILFFESRMIDNLHTSERYHWTTAVSWICTFSIYLHNTQYFNNQRRTPALASRRDRSWQCSQPTMSSTSYSPPFSSCTSSGATSSSKLPTRWGLITCRQTTRYKKAFLSGDVGRWYSDGHKESVRELQWLVTRNWKIFILFFLINDWSLHFGKVCYIFSLSQREKFSTEAFASELCLLTYFWNEFSGPSVFLWSWMVLDHLSSLEATRINLRPV